MVTHVRRTVIVIGLCAIAVFALLYRLGDVSLIDPDEPRYAESAREMIETGSVMVPYFNYEPRINKPVLYYWSICASYLLLGVSEFSARLPSALAALALLLAAFFFIKRCRGFATAAGSALILASSPLFFVPGRLAMPDMLLALFVTLSLFCFYLGWCEQGQAQKKRWYFLFYLFQVAAAWTKGPVGILIPLGVVAASLWRERDQREWKQLRPGRSIAAVLLASLPWYLYIFLHVDRSAMAAMSTEETLGRFFGSWGHDFDPLYYYFKIVLPGLLPWTVVLPWALRKRMRMPAGDRLRTFLETWVMLVFVFFSLCAMKKPQYIILLTGAFAPWLAIIIAQAVRESGGRRDTWLIASLFVFLALVIIGSFKGLSLISKKEPELLAGGIVAGCTLILPALAALWLAARGHARTALATLSLVTLLSLVAVLHHGTEFIEKRRSIKAFLQANEALVAQAQEIYAGVKKYNGLPFYLRRQVFMDTEPDFLLEKLRGPAPCLVITDKKRYNRNKEYFEPYLTARQYKKVLLSNFAAGGRP